MPGIFIGRNPSLVYMDAPPPGPISHGIQVNATNTGIAGKGLTNSDLTPLSGGNFTASNQVYTRRLITGTVMLNANNVTFRECRWQFTGGQNTKAVFVAGGTNHLFEDCTIAPTSGSWYFGIHFSGGAGSIVRRCDISNCENNINIEDDNITLEYNYLHDSSNASNPGGHRDAIEIYAGDNSLIRLNRITHPPDETAAINIAPFFGNIGVNNTRVQDNFLDGGNMHFVIDVQSTGDIKNTRVLRNIMGGHTNPGAVGRYFALNNVDGREIVEDEVELAGNQSGILWPSSGPDINTWGECEDLVPDRTGQTITV